MKSKKQKKLRAHPSMRLAMEALASARAAFIEAREQGQILGNDNHIGDIGEYWVKLLLERDGLFLGYADSKNSLFDIELTDGRKVSVKTITEWASRGYGTQVKPIDGENWQLLAAVYLDQALHPLKIALVDVEELATREPFPSNTRRRQDNGTKAFPRFEWWSWLDEYLVYER